ncbi:MAG: hypothetical protein CVU99_07855 [Firmicutes bacterium HGW-Firmicutes-4]|nr:MAG: hypothetical protein CVU99_07855 [Firmicutes bacterium HGW-Firmicutes-4]
MIYIVSKGDYVSGGPETLHQAANIFASMGQRVGMFYVQPHSNKIPNRFKGYNVEVVSCIIDSKDNILIVPETQTYILAKYQKIKKCIWWLSLENYINTEPFFLVNWRMKVNHWPKFMFPVAYMGMILKGKIHRYRYRFEDAGEFYHAYNCEYARRYILQNGVPKKKTLYLCGPLNQSFFDRSKEMSNEKRDNIILYNPEKGKIFTQKLIKEARIKGLDAVFCPIQNMTPDQIVELLAHAKVYMDFGNFPGPERIPREAVIMGCNIITSRNGAAANDIDVPIPDDLKFEDKDENIPDIIDKLRDMLQNYETYYPFYDEYREKVVNQIRLLPVNAKILLERI